MIRLKENENGLSVSGNREILLEIVDRYNLVSLINKVEPSTFIFKEEYKEEVLQAIRDYMDDVLFDLISGYNEIYNDFVKIDLDEVEHTPLLIEEIGRASCRESVYS